MSEDAKKLVLSRRARFVAAAIAGLGAAACGKEKAEEKPVPGTCLSVFMLPDAGADTNAGTAADAGPPPRPCLSRAMPRDAGPCKCSPGDPLCTCL
jgi:hypothetical protein